ncbi:MULTISPECIES: helix-turn-helix domain-containing protein [Rhodopseudomonas]|uniref:AraC family transcriptional regulator n=1 Tax=Rhodopseudomonas palustris TaxID=1076 RepID=A0A0D7DYP9_RHOPL|nr:MULTISPECIES: helix-turn-helix domain-containing protein [Rhodopseudomonas]KIZ33386.1 AraC family transcriptional regulator [Rhodopseudomonas palustris]MDF3812522.1 helix-turn-helix domain-containing protein [Rhodopseudomonas sp. BAL398]WOK17352.1 helix-turn-helix domain-containing protein [Rhodopseudomonas sp. BAL398]
MARPRLKASIPTFALYGETPSAPADLLHVEPIQSRSRLYRWEIDVHTHRSLHQMLWIESGPAAIALDEQRAQCDGPVAVIVPPGVVHGFRFSCDTEGQVFTFNPHAMIEGDVPATGQALRDLFAAPRVLQFQPGSAAMRRIASLFADLAEEFASPDASGSPVPLWLGRALVWRLAQQSERQTRGAGSGGRRDQFTRFLLLVETHHREHWGIARYAAALGMTPERLNRLAKAETGQSALDIVHARLTREACRRLTYIAAPISRLAFELGFEDPAYFCRFFKRRTGHNPRDYRRMAAAQA